MKKADLSEHNFEVAHITKVLVEQNNYSERDVKKNYDRDLCLDKNLLIGFITNTQKDEWNKLKEQYGDEIESKFLTRVNDQIREHGTLDVLRNGIKDRGAKFDLAYFKPVSGLNPEHKKVYQQNTFSVIRQLAFSKEYQKTLDMVLFLNGLPIITAELKNILTGQNFQNAVKQYKYDRDPREQLFKNCLAHFAIDNDKVYFTTELKGGATKFLPFNKDIENPDDPRGFKVAYLYCDIWHPDSLLDIIAHFIQIEIKKDKKTRKEKRSTIFPRYHQLKAVNHLVEDAKNKGSGHNYLVQHSAGSGKTYTISWLAHHLSQIYNQDNKRIFDSVVVVSDRLVIDTQLKEAVKQFEKTPGVVVTVEHAKDLKEGLEKGKNIMVSTIQKFPYIVDEISKLAGTNFAVIIDEAHSSQGGEMTRKMKKTLTYVSLGKAEELDKDNPEETVEDAIVEDIKSRGRLKNVSFFAFTATPKRETLELFGSKQADGTFHAFSLYSMKQAIEEGFILDVLEHYLTYKTYFKLVKKIEDDPEFEKRKATVLLCNYVSLSEHAIAKKVEIMLSHFMSSTEKEINHSAKAMVVTKSRLHAVRYKLEFDKQLKARNTNFKAMVAFTSTVIDPSDGLEHTESSMNGIGESQTRKAFDTQEYRILIVANKYQTGFDQPLLQTMYVDKKLSGVNAVQALSRLNRTTDFKDKAFVLDFVNEADDIKESFKPYYETTILSEATDPNHLYKLESEISKFNIIEKNDIEQFVKDWFTTQDQSLLHKSLDPAVIRYQAKNKDDKFTFRDLVRQYVKLYGFISQLVTFTDKELEKLYLYCRWLLKKLPTDGNSLPKEILETVDIESYKPKPTGGGKIIIEGHDKPLTPGGPTVKALVPEEKDKLSKIIGHLNEIFGTEFSDGDKLKIEKIAQTIKGNKDFQVTKVNNTKDALKVVFKELFRETLADMYESDFKFYEKVEKDPKIKDYLEDELFEKVLST